jgi:hypothetical protein
VGGLYTDISLHNVADIKFFQNYDMVLCEDSNPMDIFNAVMYVKKPKNKFLFFCIEKITDIILEGKYGENILDITGPTRLGKLFREYHQTMPKHGENYFTGMKLLFLKLNHQEGTICLENEILLARHPDYNNIRKFYSKKKVTNHYGDMWNLKNVYHESL